MAILLKATFFVVLSLSLVEFGSAVVCKQEGFLGISTYMTCPQPGQPQSFSYCCGDEDDRRCCQNVLDNIDQETIDKLVENSLVPVAHIRRPRQAGPLTNNSSIISTNTNKQQAATEAPITPDKVDENQGRISDAAKKAKDKIKDKVKTKAKDKITKVVEKETKKNLPRIIGILFGVVAVLILVCVVCCCCCPFCLLAKRRNRGHITREVGEVTVTVPQAQPLQPQGPQQPYMQPQGYPQQYPAQPYPAQPGYPPQQGYPPQAGYPGQQPYPAGAPGPMPTAGYPDQPPPYQEKQPAFNPNYGQT